MADTLGEGVSLFEDALSYLGMTKDESQELIPIVTEFALALGLVNDESELTGKRLGEITNLFATLAAQSAIAKDNLDAFSRGLASGNQMGLPGVLDRSAEWQGQFVQWIRSFTEGSDATYDLGNQNDLKSFQAWALEKFGDQSFIDMYNELVKGRVDIPGSRPRIGEFAEHGIEAGVFERTEDGLLRLAEAAEETSAALNPFLELGSEAKGLIELPKTTSLLLKRMVEFSQVVGGFGFENAEIPKLVFDEFGNELVEVYNRLRKFGQVIPEALKQMTDWAIQEGILERTEDGLLRLAESAEAASEALSPFAELGSEAKSLIELPKTTSLFLKRMVEFSQVLRGFGFENAEIPKLVFDEFGNELVEVYNRLRKFGQVIPEALKQMADWAIQEGMLERTEDGLLRLAKAAEDTVEALNPFLELGSEAKSLIELPKTTSLFLKRMVEFSQVLRGFGFEDFELPKLVFDEFGNELVEVYNRLHKFGQVIPEALKQISNWAIQHGILAKDMEGFLYFIKDQAKDIFKEGANLAKRIVEYRDDLINRQDTTHVKAQSMVLQKFGPEILDAVGRLRSQQLPVPEVLDRLAAVLESQGFTIPTEFGDTEVEVDTEAIEDLADSVGSFLTEGGELEAYMKEATSIMEEQMKDQTGLVKEHYEEMTEVMKQGWEVLLASGGKYYGEMTEATKRTLEALLASGESTGKMVEDLTNTVGSSLTDLADSVGSFLTEGGGLDSYMKEATGIMEEQMKGQTGLVKEYYEEMVEVMKQGWEVLLASGGGYGKMMEDLTDTVGSSLTGLTSSVGSSLTDLADKVGSFLTGGGGLESYMKESTAIMEEQMKGQTGLVKKYYEEMVEVMKQGWADLLASGGKYGDPTETPPVEPGEKPAPDPSGVVPLDQGKAKALLESIIRQVGDFRSFIKHQTVLLDDGRRANPLSGKVYTKEELALLETNLEQHAKRMLTALEQGVDPLDKILEATMKGMSQILGNSGITLNDTLQKAMMEFVAIAKAALPPAGGGNPKTPTTPTVEPPKDSKPTVFGMTGGPTRKTPDGNLWQKKDGKWINISEKSKKETEERLSSYREVPRSQVPPGSTKSAWDSKLGDTDVWITPGGERIRVPRAADGGLVRVHDGEAILNPLQQAMMGMGSMQQRSPEQKVEITYNMDWTINVLDASDLEETVDKRIIPNIIDSIERDSRGSRRNLRRALNLDEG